MILTDEQLPTTPAELASEKEAEEIIKELECELTASKIRGVGLAAPQIGINKAVAIVRVQSHEPIKLDLVNPRIVFAEELVEFEEGCLSFPGKATKTIRYKYIWIETQDNYNYMTEQLNAKRYRREYINSARLTSNRRVIMIGGEDSLSQLTSVCVQHESAHLLGLTMFDFEAHEVGRNDACPCNNGRKNKKCHNYSQFNNNLKKLFNPNYRSI